MSDFLSGPDFYDYEEIFDVYMNHRLNRPETPNDTMEKPVIWELMGDVSDQKVLDLGCGDGRFGLALLDAGARSYLGIDGSINMIEIAKKNLESSTATVQHISLETWIYPANRFDLVVSRLVLHYIDDINRVFKHVYQTLDNNGRFVFSIEHPVITSSERRWEGKGKRQDWLVDNYFNSGCRENSWLGGKVVKYHRTIEQIFGGLQDAGFTVKSLREATPIRENFISKETFERRQRIPLFLIVSATKNK